MGFIEIIILICILSLMLIAGCYLIFPHVYDLYKTWRRRARAVSDDFSVSPCGIPPYVDSGCLAETKTAGSA